MQANTQTGFRYRWYAVGDLNAFFALMFDNVANLALFGLLLTGIFKIPAEIVYMKMFPGTAIGVLIGDAIYTWMAVRLAKRTQKRRRKSFLLQFAARAGRTDSEKIRQFGLFLFLFSN